MPVKGEKGLQYIYVDDALPGGLLDQTTVRFVDVDGDGNFDGVVRKYTSEVVPVAALTIEAKKLFRAHTEIPFQARDRFETDPRYWMNQRIADAISQNSNKACGLSFSSYLSLIEEYRESDNAITEEEIDDLYHVANECGPEVTGQDAHQLAFYHLVGIPNPEYPSNPSKPEFISSRLATYFPEDHPVFEEPGYLSATGENLCMSYDVTSPFLCDGEPEPQEPEIHRIRWSDNGMRDTWREEILTNNSQESNWRIARKSPNYEEGMDIIRKNLPYKDAVHTGIQRVLESAKDPWELIQKARDIRVVLIQSRGIITQEAKRFYNSYVNFIVETLIQERIGDPAYFEYFVNAERWDYNETIQATRTREEIKDTNVDAYRATTTGAIHEGSVVITGGITLWQGIPALIALAKGTAAASALFPPLLIGMAITCGVLLIGAGVVRGYHYFKAKEGYENQFTKSPEWKELKIPENKIREAIAVDFQTVERGSRFAKR